MSFVDSRRTCSYGYFYTFPVNSKQGITPLLPPVSATQKNESKLSVTFAHSNSCYHSNIWIVVLWKEQVVDISYISVAHAYDETSLQFIHIYLSIPSSLNFSAKTSFT